MGYSNDSFDWMDFERYLRAERGLSVVSAGKALDMLRLFGDRDYSLALCSFDINALQDALISSEKRYPSRNSRNLLKNTLKHWVRYIFSIDSLDTPVPKRETLTLGDRLRRWIRREREGAGIDIDDILLARIRRMLKAGKSEPRKPSSSKKRLTLSNIVDLILSAKSNRWKAILALLFDLAPRPGEICALDYSDVHGTSDTWIVEFRREKSRNIERHEIMTWIGHMFFVPYHVNHPRKEGPLFAKRGGGRMDTSALRQNLYDRTRRRGIEGYPYALRKEGSTFWERRKIMPISSIRKRLGQAEDSRVFEKHYLIHDVAEYNDDVANAQGRFVPSVEPYVQRYCIHCGTINPPKDEPLYPLLKSKGLVHSKNRCFRCHSILVDDDIEETLQLERLELEGSYTNLQS